MPSEDHDDILPQIQKELADSDDSDDEDKGDDYNDNYHEEYNNHSSSNSNNNNNNNDNGEKIHNHGGLHVSVDALEEQLSHSMAELTALRRERQKQRQQLDQVTKEHQSLITQKDLRIERIKLYEHLRELEGTVDAKALLKRLAIEELEQTKSHLRQLQKTLRLLQGGVEHILEQSANDPSTTLEGRSRAAMRQALLKQILEQDWNSELHKEISNHGDEDIQLFHHKNTRYESIDSMISEIASISPRDMMMPPKREGRTKSRSKYYKQEQEEEERQRSHSLSSHQTYEKERLKSKKSSSRRGVRRTKSMTMASTPDPPTSLSSMIDGDRQGVADADDAGSQDTPKTNNTQGTR